MHKPGVCVADMCPMRLLLVLLSVVVALFTARAVTGGSITASDGPSSSQCARRWTWSAMVRGGAATMRVANSPPPSEQCCRVAGPRNAVVFVGKVPV